MYIVFSDIGYSSFRDLFFLHSDGTNWLFITFIDVFRLHKLFMQQANLQWKLDYFRKAKMLIRHSSSKWNNLIFSGLESSGSLCVCSVYTFSKHFWSRISRENCVNDNLLTVQSAFFGMDKLFTLILNWNISSAMNTNSHIFASIDKHYMQTNLSILEQ